MNPWHLGSLAPGSNFPMNRNRRACFPVQCGTRPAGVWHSSLLTHKDWLPWWLCEWTWSEELTATVWNNRTLRYKLCIYFCSKIITSSALRASILLIHSEVLGLIQFSCLPRKYIHKGSYLNAGARTIQISVWNNFPVAVQSLKKMPWTPKMILIKKDSVWKSKLNVSNL